MVKYALTGHEQINVDSRNGDVIPVTTMSEEEAYQKIEETFKFAPVELYYLPDGVEFLELSIGEEMQGIYMTYGKNQNVKLTYHIRPNYRLGSMGKDMEDEFVEEYVEQNDYTSFYIRKYIVEQKEERYSIQFEYKDVTYSLLVLDTSKEEVNKIIKNLFFS